MRCSFLMLFWIAVLCCLLTCGRADSRMSLLFTGPKSKGKLRKGKPKKKTSKGLEEKVNPHDLSSECQMYLYKYLEKCPFGDPTTGKERRNCDLIINTFLQKCIHLTKVPGEPGMASFKGTKTRV